MANEQTDIRQQTRQLDAAALVSHPELGAKAAAYGAIALERELWHSHGTIITYFPLVPQAYRFAKKAERPINCAILSDIVQPSPRCASIYVRHVNPQTQELDYTVFLSASYSRPFNKVLPVPEAERLAIDKLLLAYSESLGRPLTEDFFCVYFIEEDFLNERNNNDQENHTPIEILDLFMPASMVQEQHELNEIPPIGGTVNDVNQI